MSGDAVIQIGGEDLGIQINGQSFCLNYADLREFSPHNFHLYMDTAKGAWELSQLGHDFEGFFKELWKTYNKRSLESLFIEKAAVMEAEGEYSYTDDGAAAQGTAKISLFPDCICILPPDNRARRIPLCFVQELKLDNYTIHIVLDTDEGYELIRMGRDTVSLFDALCKCRKEAQVNWASDLKKLSGSLEQRLGEALKRYGFLQNASGAENVVHGIFAPTQEADEADEEKVEAVLPFWIAASGNGTAAVELITSEKSATYLYRFSCEQQTFIRRLRHAMEAMGTHREIIGMDEAALKENPLYFMSVQRNPHLRFLRSSVAGRIIHTESWKQKTAEFLSISEIKDIV